MCLYCSEAVFAQSIPIHSFIDETARSLQLLGKLDSSISFVVRPLISSREMNASKIYSIVNQADKDIIGKSNIRKGSKVDFQLLPVSIIQQLNTHHPYGWNDGAMIASKGYQTLLTAGVHGSYGPLEIQVMPEFVYAANPAYENNISYGNGISKAYTKILPGQSSIRLTTGAFSTGISTGNIWWGPGINSSLIMSNNAPGFLHAFMGSNRPIKTGIGSVEWQLIGGKITTDNHSVFENYNLKYTNPFSDWRYLNAYVVSYQPKWVPGLFIGITRALQQYHKDVSSSSGSAFSKYLPIIAKAVQKQSARGDDTLRTDQLASLFLRWVLAKAHLEFYIEYGVNDYNDNLRDYIMGPSHSAAHIVGVKKVLPLKQDSYLDFGFEITQMSQTSDRVIRDAGNWYIHTQIQEGYTNENQILGAGAGLGCNVQTMTATWVKGWQKLGVLFERVERDPQYHLYKWVDLSIGILLQYKYKNLVLSGKFQFINSNQYAWEKDVNRFNLHSRVSVQYLF